MHLGVGWRLKIHSSKYLRASFGPPKLISAIFQTVPKLLQLAEPALARAVRLLFVSAFYSLWNIPLDFFHVFYS